MDQKAVAQMDAVQLLAHIRQREEAHKSEQRHLKALLRCLPDGEALLQKKIAK